MKKIVLSLATIAAVVTLAVSGTSAYFTESKGGVVSGNLGAVHVLTWGGIGGNGLDFSFTNMMPGEPKSLTAYFQNTGTGNQDIWLVFPNLTALSALNTLGTYGEVHISTDVRGEIYANANLNDIPNNGTTGLPSMIRLAQNVAPGASGYVTFSFNYASKLKGGQGGVFNTYPIPAASSHDPRYTSGYEQMVFISSDGSGSGLPYQIVATQVNQTPGS